MPGNSAFQMVSERGWRRGLGNLLENELAHWWGTSMWWTQVLIWGGIVVFMLGAIIFQSDVFQLTEVVMLYSIFAGLFPAVAVIIIMQDALVGEKQEGTAAWVLSKPVSRAAFILSRLIANSLGVLVTMVIIPGILAYVVIWLGGKTALDPMAFLAALGVIFLVQLFFLTFTLMLGTFFNQRGPVIGLALALLFGQQYLLGLLPALRYFLPWTLAVPINNTNEAIVPALLLGEPVFSTLPVMMVALEAIAFVLIALYKFDREEF